MLVINLQNVEELFFRDKHVIRLLPDLRHIFDQWLLAERFPFMRSLKLQAQIDLLNSLSQHLDTLEEYFDDHLVVDTLDYHIAKDITLALVDAEQELNRLDSFENIAVSRGADGLYISMWR